jgi:nitrite reductase/ring-hydroxylating ferredoxin subunit
VWENVHDWEHLPWLHCSTFRSIALEEAGAWGWRARVGLQPEPAGAEILLELRRDPAAPRYVARTLAGPGVGTEIWTHLGDEEGDRTAIEVEFWLPGVDPAHADALGSGYTRLYQRLWDEDEAMMQRREQELRGARGSDASALALGPVEALRAKLPLCVELGGQRWRLVELEGELVVHATRCPHWLGPLDRAPVEGGVVTCPWHGWRFDVRTGLRVDGRPGRLARPPRIELDAASGVRLVAG